MNMDEQQHLHLPAQRWAFGLVLSYEWIPGALRSFRIQLHFGPYSGHWGITQLNMATLRNLAKKEKE